MLRTPTDALLHVRDSKKVIYVTVTSISYPFKLLSFDGFGLYGMRLRKLDDSPKPRYSFDEDDSGRPVLVLWPEIKLIVFTEDDVT